MGYVTLNDVKAIDEYGGNNGNRWLLRPCGEKKCEKIGYSRFFLQNFGGEYESPFSYHCFPVLTYYCKLVSGFPSHNHTVSPLFLFVYWYFFAAHFVALAAQSVSISVCSDENIWNHCPLRIQYLIFLSKEDNVFFNPVLVYS